MQISDRVADLDSYFHRRLICKPATVHSELFSEGLALDILHHQIVRVLLAERVVDVRNVLVAEASEQLGLALEIGLRLRTRSRVRK